MKKQIYKHSNKLILISILFLSIFLFIFIISINVVSAVGTYPAVDPNMVLYYHFNNDSSVGESYTSGLGQNLIYDYSNAHLNNGTSINNITYNTTGGYLNDGVFEFDGVDDYINISNKMNYSILTICSWINLHKLDASNFDTIFSSDVGGGAGGYVFRIKNNLLYFYITYTNNTQASFTSTSGITNNIFNYVCVVYNSSNGWFYINGILSGNWSGSLGSKSYNKNSKIGVLNFNSANIDYFNGSIDEVIVWNHSFDINEMYNLYNDYTLIPLNISVYNPTPNNNSNQLTGTSFIVNYSLSKLNIDSSWINFNGEDYYTYQYGTSTSCYLNGIYYCSYQFNDNQLGNYNFTIYAQDQNGNLNNTNTYFINFSNRKFDYSTKPYINDSSALFYYHFNNESVDSESYTLSNNFVYDYSSLSYNATSYGNISYNITGGYFPNLTGGYLNDGAFKFDGVDDVINNTFKTRLDNLTLCSWVKVNDVSATTKTLINSWSSDGGFRIDAYSDDLIFWIRNSSGHYDLISSATYQSSTLNINNWFYVCGVRYSNSTFQLYVNGINFASEDNITGQVGSASLGFLIGKVGGGGNYLNGSVDEIILLNRSLDSNEMYNLYDDYTGLSCGSSPTRDCTIIQSTNFNTGTYNLNGSSNGAIQIIKDNIIFDCNGSTIYGNWINSTTSLINGIRVSGNNITIKNCILKDYERGIKIESNENNISIINITTNHTRYGLIMYGGNNTLINNNRFHNNSYGIYSSGKHYNVNISFNDFQWFKSRYIWFDTGSIYQGDFNNNNITNFYGNVSIGITNFIGYFSANAINSRFNNNYLEGRTKLTPFYSEAYDLAVVSFYKCFNVTLENNKVMYSGYGLHSYYCDNITYLNNNLTNNDIGVMTLFSTNVNILSNYFNNITSDYDNYNIGMRIYNTSNFIIENNIMTKLGTGGIWLGRYNKNGIIRNNSYDFVPDNERYLYVGRDWFMGRSAIFITPYIKSWGGGTNWTENINFNNTNITIYNEIYSSNVPRYLVSESAYNINFTTSYNYVYQKFDAYPVLINIENWINPNQNKQVSYTFTKINVNKTMYGYNGIYKLEEGFLDNGKSLYFGNFQRNQADNLYGTNNNYFNISTYNRTNSLIYHSNNSILCLTNNLYNGNCNFSLSPNEKVYAIDNFNCSESLQSSSGYPCGRENSPINITSVSISSLIKNYHISSLITNNITLPMTLEIPTEYRVKSVNITPKELSNYIPSYSTLGNKLMIENVNLSYSTTSNEINVEYESIGHYNACTDSVNAFISYVSLLGILGVIVFLSLALGYFLGIIDKDKFRQISIISTLVTLILVGILIIIGIFIISTMCSL